MDLPAYNGEAASDDFMAPCPGYCEQCARRTPLLCWCPACNRWYCERCQPDPNTQPCPNPTCAWGSGAAQGQPAPGVAAFPRRRARQALWRRRPWYLRLWHALRGVTERQYVTG